MYRNNIYDKKFCGRTERLKCQISSDHLEKRDFRRVVDNQLSTMRSTLDDARQKVILIFRFLGIFSARKSTRGNVAKNASNI